MRSGFRSDPILPFAQNAPLRRGDPPTRVSADETGGVLEFLSLHDDMSLLPERGHNQHAAVVEFDTQTPVLKAIPEAGDSPAFYTF